MLVMFAHSQKLKAHTFTANMWFLNLQKMNNFLGFAHAHTLYFICFYCSKLCFVFILTVALAFSPNCPFKNICMCVLYFTYILPPPPPLLGLKILDCFNN
jgi:hypothetical protein